MACTGARMDPPPSPRSRRRGPPLRTARPLSSSRSPASPRTPSSPHGKPPLSPAHKPPPSPKEASKPQRSNVTVHDKIWSDLKEAFVLGEKKVELEKQLSPLRGRRTVNKNSKDELEDCETSSTSSSSSSLSQDTQVHVDDLHSVTDTSKSPSSTKGSPGSKADELKDVKESEVTKSHNTMDSKPKEEIKRNDITQARDNATKDINDNDDKFSTKMTSVIKELTTKQLPNNTKTTASNNKENRSPTSRFSYPRACQTLDNKPKIRHPKPTLDLSLSTSTPSLASQGFSVRDIQGELQGRKSGSLDFKERGKSGSLNVVTSPACQMASASPVMPRKVTGIGNNIFFKSKSSDGIARKEEDGEEDDGYESQTTNSQFRPKVFHTVERRPETNSRPIIRATTQSKNDVSALNLPASDRSASSAKSIKHANGVANVLAKRNTTGEPGNTEGLEIKEVKILAAPLSVKPKGPVQGQPPRPTLHRNADHDLGHDSINNHSNIGQRRSNTDSVRQNPMTQECAECGIGTRDQLVSHRDGSIKVGTLTENEFSNVKTVDSQEQRNSKTVSGSITPSPYIPPGKRLSLLTPATATKSKQPQRASVTLPVIFSDRKNINGDLPSVAQLASMHTEKGLGATIVTDSEETALAIDNAARDKGDDSTSVTNNQGTSQRYAPIAQDNKGTEEAVQKSLTCTVRGDSGSGSAGRASKHGVYTKMSKDTSRDTGFGSLPGYTAAYPTAGEMSAAAANTQHKNKQPTLTGETTHVAKLPAGITTQQDNKLLANERIIGGTERTTPSTQNPSARDDSSPRPSRINYSMIDGAGAANELRPKNGKQIGESIKQHDGNITPEQNSPSKSDNSETLEGEPAEGSPGDNVVERVKRVRFRLNSKNEDIVETDKAEKSAYEKLFGHKFKKSKAKTQKPTGSILVVPKDKTNATPTEDKNYVVQSPTIDVKIDDDVGTESEKDKVTKKEQGNNTGRSSEPSSPQHQPQQQDKKPLEQQHQKQQQPQQKQPKQPPPQLNLKQQQQPQQQHEKQSQQPGQQPLPSPQYLKHHPKQHEKKLPQQPPPQQQELRHQQQKIHQQQLQQELKNVIQQEQKQHKQRQQQHGGQQQQPTQQKQPQPKQSAQQPQPKQPVQQLQPKPQQQPQQPQQQPQQHQQNISVTRDNAPLKEKQNLADTRLEEKPKRQLKKIPLDILQGIPQEVYYQTLTNPDTALSQDTKYADDEEQYINSAKTKNIMAKLASLQYNNSLGAKYVDSPLLNRHLLDVDALSSRSSSPHTDGSYPSQEPWGASSSQNDSLDSSAILATYPEDASQYSHVTQSDAGLPNQVLPGHQYGMGANHLARSSANSDPYATYNHNNHVINPTDAGFASHVTSYDNSSTGLGHSPQSSVSGYDYPQNPYAEVDYAPPMPRPLSAYELSSAHETKSQDPQYATQDRSKPVYASTKDILKMMGAGRRKPEQTATKFNTYPYK